MGLDRPRGHAEALVRTLSHFFGAGVARVTGFAVRAATSASLSWAYALVLLATTAVLRTLPAVGAHRLLRLSSTDVWHLGHDPFVVLVLSALWLPGRLWFPYALVLVLLAAPLERRIGSALAASVFFSGHVIATLLTELPIAAAIAFGWLPAASGHRIDVGASYGLLAVAAAFAGGLSRLRGLGILVTATLLVVGLRGDAPDMEMYGHLLALTIGVCWWPRLYGRFPWRARRKAGPGPQ